MSDYIKEIDYILTRRTEVPIEVRCMGTFDVYLHGLPISSKSWGRDKTLQLFQFLVTARHRRALHKEQIISRLWEDADGEGGDRDFKVALHGVNKTLEPNRPSRSEAKYIIRQGLSYQLKFDTMWVDTEVIERFIAIGNATTTSEPDIAIRAYREAVSLCRGVYLPSRMYEDWTSEERERLQLLILGAYISLSQLMVEDNPQICIQLCQEALMLDRSWEDAYRIQMQAYMGMGNRPMAIKSYKKCVLVLEEEFGIEPLPQTKELLQAIMKHG